MTRIRIRMRIENKIIIEKPKRDEEIGTKIFNHN
jgi:hypothetical protein